MGRISIIECVLKDLSFHFFNKVIIFYLIQLIVENIHKIYYLLIHICYLLL